MGEHSNPAFGLKRAVDRFSRCCGTREAISGLTADVRMWAHRPTRLASPLAQPASGDRTPIVSSWPTPKSPDNVVFNAVEHDSTSVGGLAPFDAPSG